MNRDPIRRAALGSIALLFLVSIPWYRETGAQPAIWWGLPDWVAVSLACYGISAGLNAWAWRRTRIPEPDEPPPEDL